MVLAGATPVLVHNSNCPTGGDSVSPSSPKRKHPQPDENTEGSHTLFERDENGRIIRYQTWIEEPRSPSGWRLGPRFRGTGKPHSGVNPPLHYPKDGGFGESATGEHLPLGY
ncbi:hypothetical protein EYS09_03750 [Streptomyces kasugaensis]|uniref:Bacterial toxin 24 domain-containing protein n=1 Tax=Streptomyces kasugaensis TaxID=1946 RepID=A0A4Q9HZY4_STRKA|nr:hypothetical protein EYS09_03750 [Streptomyces kasugaensis]